MAVVVVATGLVREARSKSVATSTSKSPLLGKDARSGASSASSYTNFPKDCRAQSLPTCVTAMEAPGKARWAIASRRMEKAEEKISPRSSKDASSRECVVEFSFVSLPGFHAERVIAECGKGCQG